MNEEQLEPVFRVYKNLRSVEGSLTIEGTIEIGENDIYQVRIDYSSFPNRFPSVWEIGGRIPRKSDRHIYTDTGSCCFTTAAMASILLRTEINDLEGFITKIIVPYLENNSYYELNSCYAGPEYAHNSEGILQSYSDILEIKQKKMIAFAVLERATGGKRRPNDECYCGSGMKLKNCLNGAHAKAYARFKLIGKGILQSDFEHHLKSHLPRRWPFSRG